MHFQSFDDIFAIGHVTKLTYNLKVIENFRHSTFYSRLLTLDPQQKPTLHQWGRFKDECVKNSNIIE